MRHGVPASSLIALALALAACHEPATQPAQLPNGLTDMHCELAVSCKIPAHVTILPTNADLTPGDTIRLTAYVDADSGVNTSVDWDDWVRTDYDLIYLIAADGGAFTRLTNGMDAGSPAWAP